MASAADDLGLWIGEMATFDAFALGTAVGRITGLTLTIGPLAVGTRTPTSMAIGTASVPALTGRPARLGLGASSPVVVNGWHGRHWGATARNLAVAAERADRLVMNMVTAASAARLVTRLRRLCGSAPTPEVAVRLPATVDPTPDDHAQLAHAHIGYIGAPGYGEMLREAGYGGLVDLARSRAHPRTIAGSIPPELDDVVGLAGTARHLEDRIAEYHAVGIVEVCLVPTTATSPGGARTLEALAPG